MFNSVQDARQAGYFDWQMLKHHSPLAADLLFAERGALYVAFVTL
jgi:hypothetical protein